MVAELKLQIKDAIQRIDRITPGVKIVSSTERIKKILPLKSIEEIKNMDACFEQQDFVDEYVSKKFKLQKLDYILYFYIFF